MLNTKQNLKNKKITEAIQASAINADPVLLIEILSSIRETSSNMIETMNLEYLTYEDIAISYELAEMCNYALDKIYAIINGID